LICRLKPFTAIPTQVWQHRGDDLGSGCVAAEGALTCTPWTNGRTASSISWAIRIPSRRAASGEPVWAMAQQDLLGHGNAQVVFHELRVAQAGERPDAGDNGNPMASMRSRKLSSRRRSKTGWVMAYSAPASTLKANRRSSCSMSARRVGGHADGEVGAGPDGVGAYVEAHDSADGRC